MEFDVNGWYYVQKEKVSVRRGIDWSALNIESEEPVWMDSYRVRG